MTAKEAIKILREDYCGYNRIICEPHPDKCNQEECEIWCAIKALEIQPDGDCISRSAAVDALRMDISIIPFAKAREYVREAIETIYNRLEDLPSVQPERSSEIQDILEYLDTVLHPIISPDHWDVYSELHDMISMLPSAQPETCDTCKYGRFGDGMCDDCRVRFQSNYERRTDD